MLPGRITYYKEQKTIPRYVTIKPGFGTRFLPKNSLPMSVNCYKSS